MFVRGDFALLQRAMKLLGDSDMPYLVPAMDQAGQIMTANIRGFMPGSFKIKFFGVKKTKANLRARGRVTHKAARVREFGKTRFNYGYTRPGTGKIVGGSIRKVSPGIRPKPMVGIIAGDAATAASRAPVRAMLEKGIQDELNRVLAVSS
jgi:hypothetical protein